MAKVRFKLGTLKTAQKNLQKQLLEGIAKTKAFRAADKVLRETIREGQNPKTGKNYRALKSSTVRHRRYIAKYNKTHPKYSPNRSNLTLTGALIDSIKSSFNKRSGILSLFVTGDHPGYKRKDGKQIKKSKKKNADIVGYLEDQNRQVLSISKKFTQILRQSINEAIRRL